MELRNSKLIPLGGGKFVSNSFIGAVLMSEDGRNWQDVKPYLVRDADGWHIEGAPYYAEVKDDGTRLFCPDRNERSRFLYLSNTSLLAPLNKYVVSMPTKLDGQVLGSNIVMPALWGELRFIFTNTGMKFEVLMNEPPEISGETFDKFTLDHDTAGLDLIQLLSSKRGLGIPRPVLIDNDGEERWLDWSYNAGQLELGFDLSGLKFPILLKNTTIDVDVGASADDGYSGSGGTFVYDSQSWLSIGHRSGETVQAWYRFTGISIPQGSTIDSNTYISLNEYASNAAALTKIYAEDTNNPTAPTSQADHASRVRTAAGVDWDGDPGDMETYCDSPSIQAVIQELVTSYDYDNEAILILHDDDGSGSETSQLFFETWQGAGYVPKLHIEYTAGGGGTSAKRGWWSK